jgi:predicted AAA+ superfamily ATPase
MIKRNITEEINELLSYFPVVGIVGSRQVGKTTLIKTISDILDKEVVYFDLENPADLSKLTEPLIYLKKLEHKCVILDEIQRASHLFPIMRSLIDQHRIPSRFIISGSASPDLIRDSSESLAGRIAYKELTPFNILEVNMDFNFEQHWLRGGYPLSLLAPSFKLSKVWLDNYIQTYIERDLPLLGLSVSPTTLRNLWSMLSHIHVNILNLNLLSKSLEITSPTLKKYIQFLAEAYLLRILQPFHFNIRKRIVKSPKIYIRDTGLLHSMLGIQSIEQLYGHPIIGHSWEGYVIEQLYPHCYSDFDMYFYRTHHGAECDLILTKANTPLFSIEIKYTAAPKVTKGLLNSISDLGTKKNYIICLTEEDYPIAENILVCNVSSFIQNHLNNQ